MAFELKIYDSLLGIEGLSDELLKNHFTLYEGYVKNANKLNDSLWALADAEKTEGPEYAELKRRGGWELNGIRLHELYFENLTKDPKELDPESALYEKIEKDMKGLENFKKLFLATAAIRGIGWAVLYYDKGFDRLFNMWINEHDTGHLAGATPLLVIDCFEHAYMLDYGIKKPAYLEAVLKVVDWEKVAERFEKI